MYISITKDLRVAVIQDLKNFYCVIELTENGRFLFNTNFLSVWSTGSLKLYIKHGTIMLISWPVSLMIFRFLSRAPADIALTQSSTSPLAFLSTNWKISESCLSPSNNGFLNSLASPKKQWPPRKYNSNPSRWRHVSSQISSIHS